MDLFSGYGGISLALSPWVRPVLYCEIERYPQSILISRMADGELTRAPIWDDIRTLDGRTWRGTVDIIYGGFPCQDLSLAGAGRGLEGERSGLFFEIIRLVDEVQPALVFMENVPAIRTRGLDRVLKELAVRGYDCRWRMLSAQEIGAPHVRKRWFLLAADSQRLGLRDIKQRLPGGRTAGVSDKAETITRNDGQAQSMADTFGPGLEGARGGAAEDPASQREGWWSSESGICRVAHGTRHRVDRIKALGNGVVPAQVREAFQSLMFGCQN